jgi:hypothetical protein
MGALQCKYISINCVNGRISRATSHTQTKGYDNVVVRALNSHPKVVQTIYIHWVWHGLPYICIMPILGGRHAANPNKSWNIIHILPCKNPRRIFIHNNLCGPLHAPSPSSVNLSLGDLNLFHPMGDLRMQWWRAFGLVCEVVPRPRIL